MYRLTSRGIFLIFLPLWASGCTQAWNDVYRSETDHHVSSSLVDYLYPDQQPVKAAQQPVRPLKDTPQFWLSGTAGPAASAPDSAQLNRQQLSQSPPANALRVGLAFVPTEGEIPGLSEARKVSLLRQVHAILSRYSFIEHVEVIPQMHLRRGKGFQQLEHIAQSFQVDTVALVSYDQVIHTDDNKLAFLYLTVVGAYLVPGSEYDTQTFVDAVLVNVKSRQIVLRAVGVDNTESATTLIGSTQSKRNKRYESFERAFGDMLSGLSANTSVKPVTGINTNNPARRDLLGK
ncbi:MAG TPA: rhombotarget lipoprotein [Gammaproteobacteria bacterium]